MTDLQFGTAGLSYGAAGILSIRPLRTGQVPMASELFIGDEVK